MARKPPQMHEVSLPDNLDVSGAPFPIRWRITPNEETDPDRVFWALRERIKELNCLYAIAHLAEGRDRSIEDILREVVEIIPPSWQYPEVTCGRIVFQGTSYKSNGFRHTAWRQSSPILMYGESAGEVTVCYLEERPPADEGPFLHEERMLLDAIAERIGSIAMRIAAERELQDSNHQLMVERKALQETNTALRTVMAKIEDEKREIYRDIRTNVEKVLMPILHELYISVPREQRKFVELLRDNLEDISSPFISRISELFYSLTPTEIQICNMIKSGLRTKEIARMRGVAPATISRHRERIRRKLKIVNNDVNLATFLATSRFE